MIVDAHHHLWSGRLSWMSSPEFDPIAREFSTSDLAAETRAAGVQKTIAVQAIGDTSETEALLAAADASDGLIAGVVGWIDLTSSDVSVEIARLRSLPGGSHLVGVRHQAQDEVDLSWLLRSDVMKSIEAVDAAGLVYDLLVKGAAQMDATCELVRRLPHVQFVLDHMGKPNIAEGELQPWQKQISLLAENANVKAKLSGLVTEADWKAWKSEQIAPYIEFAIKTFGAERLMWGSDWPVCTLASDYESVFKLVQECVPASSRNAIFRDTAIRTYAFD